MFHSIWYTVNYVYLHFATILKPPLLVWSYQDLINFVELSAAKL